MDIRQKVRFLSDRRAYGGVTGAVETRETHMSWVFISDTLVYKLKKPVRYPFLDFSTVARRRFFCEEELRLNRRLAPATYRRVVPLRIDSTGGLALGDHTEGQVIDWLVEMERLPAAEMLDVRIGAGRLGLDTVKEIGTRLAHFYAACPPQRADGQLYLRTLVAEQAINRSILLLPRFDLADAAGPQLDATDRALAELTPEIEKRIRQGFIVEGHGDLRPEHVCLVQPLQIIDCLEFSRGMRVVDPYDEVNYLGLECDILGASWVRPVLLGAVAELLGHPPAPRLAALYRSFRALLRARLCIAHLLEPRVSRPEKWAPLARRYLAAAEADCISLRARPVPPKAAPPRGA